MHSLASILFHGRLDNFCRNRICLIFFRPSIIEKYFWIPYNAFLRVSRCKANPDSLLLKLVSEPSCLGCIEARKYANMSIKVLATIGPSSLNKDILMKMAENGVTLFRINLSHTALDDVKNVIKKFSLR